MIAYIVCVGVMMVLMVYIGTVISHKEIADFDGGVFFGIVFSVLFVIEVSLLSTYLKNRHRQQWTYTRERQPLNIRWSMI